MDSASRIETRKQFLRIKYASDVNGLRTYILSLGDGAAADPMVINSHSFESGQATGQVTLEPLAELNAAMAVLAELDPTNTPSSPSRIRYADFSSMPTES
jgi:hypothetical protein